VHRLRALALARQLSGEESRHSISQARQLVTHRVTL
jgi:hypothetical protein